MVDLSLQVASGGPTAVGAVLRSNQAYHELLSDKHTLQWGIAFSCPRLAPLPAGNEFREVWIDDAGQVGAALAEVDAHFAQRGVHCHRWALAESQDPGIVEAGLAAAGYRREDLQVLALGAWPSSREFDHVRVLPARPMRAAYQTVLEFASAEDAPAAREEFVVAGVDRLDDHRMDMNVAMVEGKPAGACALFQVGDIARIVDLYVAPQFRRRQVATALLDHVIAMARRLMMRIVCIETPESNAAGLELLDRMGFVNAGRTVQFHAPGPKHA
jgi:ribosomal protein S18 acetylase RimI-like enzyme